MKALPGVALLISLALSCSHRDDDSGVAPDPAAQALLPPGLRRLSMPELQRGAEAVLQTELDFVGVLPPDARQHDFSRNQSQSVDALTLTQLFDATKAAAEALDITSSAYPACAASAPPEDTACALDVVTRLSTRAFRRPATDLEISAL